MKSPPIGNSFTDGDKTFISPIDEYAIEAEKETPTYLLISAETYRKKDEYADENLSGISILLKVNKQNPSCDEKEKNFNPVRHVVHLYLII